MGYSIDLRKRVVSYVREGGNKSEAARLFGVSRWCVYDWLGRETLEPEKQGRPVGPRALCLEALKAHVESYPDAYEDEGAVDLDVSRHVVMYHLKRKKKKKNAIVPGKKRRLSE